MINLVPFEREDFVRFTSWIASADELQQFAGSIFSFPLTDDQLLHYMNDPKRFPYKVKLVPEGSVIGHCELNYERSFPRLCRILIADPEQRNKGFGKAIIHKLLHILFMERDFDEADLNVYDWNSQAITCYETIGFAQSEVPATQTSINGKVWNAIHMRITKADWMARKEKDNRTF